ncbi:MAG: hypothetical protein A2Y38_10230 [Spirochaetes bacterium GWB1_59_5]|nr:MAG: hypothetical protein A2Y38_10230 [Spirochaetes bacterium GWB1_59_5]
MSTDETPPETQPVISLQVIRGQKDAEAAAIANEVRKVLPEDMVVIAAIEAQIIARNQELQARHDVIRTKQAEIAALQDANTLTVIQRTAQHDKFLQYAAIAARKVGIDPDNGEMRWNLDTTTATFTRTK